MNELLRAVPHVRMHRDQVFVVKIGGGSLARPKDLRGVLRQVAAVHALGSRIVVVHGGGPQTDELQRLLGEVPEMVEGRRITTQAALRALRLATAGELNGDVVSFLRAESAPAVGLSGASVLLANRRPPVVMSGRVVDFGEVGDLCGVDPRPLHALLGQGFVPVLSPPAADGKGAFLNVNADLAAAAVAAELGAAKLVLVTGAPGVLRDPRDPASLVSSLTLDELGGLEAEGRIQGGMKVKAAAIKKALLAGVPRVHVVSGADPEALLLELYTNHGAGTLVTRVAEQVPEEAGTP